MVVMASEMVSGYKLEYARYGDWTDTCIIFFHGHAGSARYIPEEEYDYDGTKFCILSFNRPGVGNSGLRGSYKMEDFCADVREVILRHGVKNVVVTGHSAGGLYAQVFAGLYPDLTRAMILLSSLPNMNDKEADKLLSRSYKNRRRLLLYCKPITRIYFRTYAKTILENTDSIIEETMQTFGPEEQEYLNEHMDMYRNAVTTALVNKGEGAFLDAEAMYTKRKDPVLDPSIRVYVWVGGDDIKTTPEQARYLAKIYKAKSLHIEKGMTHMMYLIRWRDALNEAFYDMLEEN